MGYRVIFVICAIALCYACEACVFGFGGNVPEEMFNTVWTYNESKAAKNKGLLPPSLWKNSFGFCDTKLKSQHQSPINIKHLDAVVDSGGVMPLHFSSTTCSYSVRNIGATLSLTPRDLTSCGVYFSTANNNTYKFYEAHLHWHQHYNHRGTEHKVDGQGEAMEAHLVHYNSKFKSIDDAFEDGTVGNIAIVAIRYTVAPTAENATEAFVLDTFIGEKNLQSLQYMDINTYVNGSGFDPYGLIGDALPHNESLPLYHYNGSLSTPRCDSIVSWYIVQQTVMLSQSQIQQLRKFSHVTHQEAENPKLGFNNDANVRPVAAVNSRIVLAYPTVIEPNMSSDSALDDDGMPLWELLAIIGGSVVAAAIIIVLFVFIIKKFSKKEQYESINTSA